MSLPAIHLLGPVLTKLFSAHPGRFDRLAVHYLRRWAGDSSSDGPAPSCVGLSASSPTSHPGARSGSSGRRSSRGRVVGQQPPGAAATNDVEDRVQDLAGGVHLGTSGGVGCGQVRFEAAPFGVGEVSSVCMFSCSESHRASTSEPLFGQIHGEVRGAHLSARIRVVGTINRTSEPRQMFQCS